MEIKSIVSDLQTKFGNAIDIGKVKEHLKDIDTSKLSMTEIINKIKSAGLIGDLDKDGKKESAIEEIKGKIGDLFGKK
ncbi:MAG: hypothetical protein NC201_01435 [Prevotella sp.]|nr:hypothetical protein [Bacteroides sp.]MCM1365890.1 hypothetical protein [Prevotella sp.]